MNKPKGNKLAQSIIVDGTSVSAALAEIDPKAAQAKQDAEALLNNGGATDQADLKIQLAKKAFDAIQQAGNGLVAAANDCEANAATARTIYVLAIVQGYVVDAMAALIERENSGILGL
jgi:hypothetical protein